MKRDGASSGVPDFLAGGDEAATLITAFDWSATPLGPISDWPAHVRGIVSLILGAAAPMATLWGADGYLIYNAPFARLFGAAEAAALGRPVRDVWPDSERFEPRAITEALAGRGSTRRGRKLSIQRARRRQETFVDLDYAPIRDDAGTPAGVCVIATDLTRRVVAERKVEHENEKMRAMFDQVPVFLAMLEGPDHVYTFANQAITRLHAGRDVIGRSICDVIPEAELQGFVRLLDDAYRTGERHVSQSAVFEIADEAGGILTFHLDLVHQPVRGADGRIFGVMVQATEVSERLKAERELRDREREASRLSEALIYANEVLIAEMREGPKAAD